MSGVSSVHNLAVLTAEQIAPKQAVPILRTTYHQLGELGVYAEPVADARQHRLQVHAGIQRSASCMTDTRSRG